MSRKIMIGMLTISAFAFAGIEVQNTIEAIFTTGMSFIFLSGALYLIRENIIDKGV
jgi:hypothetical protein